MNEEFDKYVRNLLQNAEEEVSPRVWEGVAAGLAKKSRVVPVWSWAAVSVAAAAAVVAAFVVFHSNPTISSVETPAAIALVEPSAPAVVEEETSVTILEVVPVSKKAVAATRSNQEPVVTVSFAAPVSAQAVSADVRPATVQVKEPVRILKRKAIAPDTDRLALVDDHSLLNQLAYAEHKPASDKGLSLLAAGHIQSNQRGEVPAMAFSKPYSAPPIGAGEGIYNASPETSFLLPFSIGLGVRYNFTNRWALGTGVRYTNLGRTFVADFVSAEGIAVPQTDIDNHQHWLGVPLNVYYDIVNRGRWRVHGFVGGTAEFLLDNDFLVHYSPKDIHYHQNSSTPQWSLSGGLGIEFRITPRVGIYLDPNFRYYFNVENQPRSLRTIQPLRFEMEAGVRFSFGQKQ